MKIGTKLTHRTTGERYEFLGLFARSMVKVLGPSGVEMIHRDQLRLRGVVNAPKTFRVRIWCDGEVEPYTLLARQMGSGRPSSVNTPRRVQIVDRETVHEGVPVWKNWIDCILMRGQFEIVPE